MHYIIGVDGGGTKTEAVAYDLEGNALDKSLTGFANLINGKEEALNNIVDAIKGLTNKYGLENLKGLYLGIAGAETGNNIDIIKEEINKKIGTTPVVVNDGELALRAMLKGEDGILTIAGTGSIAFGIKENKSTRCGGWGHMLGDEGSGYKLSIEAIKNMIYEYDNSLEKSKLTIKLMEKLNIKEVDEIIDFVYSSSKDKIAVGAPIVSMLAEEGDTLAKKILEDEAKALAKTTENVYKKLGFEKCSIGLVGGVVRKSRIFREAFEKALSENINVISFIDDNVSAAKGAYYMYKKTI
ncbi:N-acetylglucosamine kinase [Clostridium massiliamazoniense]|uniref:N-acetylglucosamine kinase n=1 Tax=Clostridium massiliamazoniense TaxID=1347366 RepID=UPI0006D852BA|nr:BadF/BadG/BcrA/BcrD ATPase family protein [Clostridium massiliamazoniense]